MGLLTPCFRCPSPTACAEHGACAIERKQDEKFLEAVLDPQPSVLEEAARIVTGPRQDAYGHPRDNHAATSAMWRAYVWRRRSALIQAGAAPTMDEVDVCIFNLLQKLSRFANTRQRDSIVDAAGFLANIEMIVDGKWDA